MSVGKVCWEDILRALGQVERKPESLGEVLDFGCGCGRVLRWAASQPYGWKFNGTGYRPAGNCLVPTFSSLCRLLDQQFPAATGIP
ncbi:MAG: hypothetical protein L0212_00410 [Acidobacteria bacterium]|nr:hypothetical protein [Acidobacteriota bacterium]